MCEKTLGKWLRLSFIISFFSLTAFSTPAVRAEVEAEESVDFHIPVNTHLITLKAVNLDSGLLAYQMVSHRIRSQYGQITDMTSKYSQQPSIPGPTIVMTEGDSAEVTLENGIADTNQDISQAVSVHVHGVHFDIDSDGTMKILNDVKDEAAFPGKPYTYKWTAAPGTAGTWPYHDHAFGNPMVGAEYKGLFGTVIVNPRSGKVPALINGKVRDVNVGDIKKELILWMHEATFWGMQVDNSPSGKQDPRGINPTLQAQPGEKVRFHVLGMGTAFHTFHLHGHRWLDPGTANISGKANIVDTVNIGPVSRHTFVIQAGESVGPGKWHFHCHLMQHMQAGMMGSFLVKN